MNRAGLLFPRSRAHGVSLPPPKESDRQQCTPREDVCHEADCPAEEILVGMENEFNTVLPFRNENRTEGVISFVDFRFCSVRLEFWSGESAKAKFGFAENKGRNYSRVREGFNY